MLDCVLEIPFIDGRILVYKKPKYVVFHPGSILVIENKGFDNGNLLLLFDIDYPEKLTCQEYRHFKHVLKHDLPQESKSLSDNEIVTGFLH